MANPQLENGHTRIANEILQRLAQTPLNGSQFRILMTVFRFTYGFQRLEADMSVSFIAQSASLSGRMVRKELKELIERKIILATKNYTKSDSRSLKFNKDFEKWEGNDCSPPHQGNDHAPGERLDPSPGERLDPSPGERLDPSQGNDWTPHEGNDWTPKKENLKENLKENIYTPQFEQFWKAYPRTNHLSKIETFKKWTASLKDKDSPVTSEQLILATELYAADCKKKRTQEQFIKHPATFLGPNKHFLAWIPKERGAPEVEDYSGYSSQGIYGNEFDDPPGPPG